MNASLAVRNEVSAAEISGPFEFDVITINDTVVTLTAAGLAACDVTSLAPVRYSANYRERRSKIGYYRLSTQQSSVAYDSGLEELALIGWDFDPRVAAISTQPFELTYNYEGSPRRYVPDALLVFRTGDVAVREVKPRRKHDDPDVQRKLIAGRLATEGLGWTWDVEPEPSPILARNLRWLSGFRHRLWDPDEITGSLLDGAAEPITIRSLLDAHDGNPIARAMVMSLLWHSMLVADLSSALLADSTVVVVPNHVDTSGAPRFVDRGITIEGRL